jgi:uncharacterized protein YndB with AHSA1/START domain
MGMQHIVIKQIFNAPVDTIFSILTDHEAFGRIINAKMKRVVDAGDENKNGLGSVRRITILPGFSFEESVVTFEPNRLMEYRITKGSPIKNHRGRMEFTQNQGKTCLTYTVDYEPRQPFFLLGSLIKSAIAKPMIKGLRKFAAQYDS